MTKLQLLMKLQNMGGWELDQATRQCFERTTKKEREIWLSLGFVIQTYNKTWNRYDYKLNNGLTGWQQIQFCLIQWNRGYKRYKNKGIKNGN